MNVPLDDDLFLYSSNYKTNNRTKDFVELWEYYEIHPSKPRKILSYGSWTPIGGLKLSKEEKWIRRRNLEVKAFFKTISHLRKRVM